MATGKTFVVVSSHLYWDPRYDYVKYAQTAYLLKRLGAFLATVPEKRPAVIVSGDFNSPPDSPSLTLFHNNHHIVRNSFHTKTFDEWYSKVWEDFQADPLAVKGALASAYR